MGDEVLKIFSLALKQTFKRETDYTIRMGGEEFSVLFKTKKQEESLFLTNKLKEEILKLNINNFNRVEQFTTASYGLLSIKEIKEDIPFEFIYKNADELLYKAKKDGKNNIKYIFK